MELDPQTLVIAGAGIAIAIGVAVVAGTVTARLFFHASGLDPEDVAARRDKPLS